MCLVSHIDLMKTIEIPIRELHARTGHFVRKAAADMRLIITDRGRPVAQLQSLGTADSGQPKRPKWKHRVLVPGYEEVMNTPVSGD